MNLNLAVMVDNSTDVNVCSPVCTGPHHRAGCDPYVGVAVCLYVAAHGCPDRQLL